MVTYYVHEKVHMEASKAFQTIFDTYNGAHTDLQLDQSGVLKKQTFSNFVHYLLLCPHSNEKVDLLHIVEKKYPRELDADALLLRYVSKFLLFELIPLDEAKLQQELLAYEPYANATEHHALHITEFTKQLIQHNIRVIEKYYTRV